jgi:hypothetical protein
MYTVLFVVMSCRSQANNNFFKLQCFIQCMLAHLGMVSRSVMIHYLLVSPSSMFKVNTNILL